MRPLLSDFPAWLGRARHTCVIQDGAGNVELAVEPVKLYDGYSRGE